MASVLKAMQAKSDQLNYDDIGTSELVIIVNSVTVNNSDQPVIIYYDGCGSRPYKPCKSMIRLIAHAWGEDSDSWVGKSMLIYGDPNVKWAGSEVGGIRIKAFSHVDKNGFSAYVTITRGKKRKIKIGYIDPTLDSSKDFISEKEKAYIIKVFEANEKLIDYALSQFNTTLDKMTLALYEKFKHWSTEFMAKQRKSLVQEITQWHKDNDTNIKAIENSYKKHFDTIDLNSVSVSKLVDYRDYKKGKINE